LFLTTELAQKRIDDPDGFAETVWVVTINGQSVYASKLKPDREMVNRLQELYLKELQRPKSAEFTRS